jgi:CubicO group peptidase (beta-lactamase class C family)
MHRIYSGTKNFVALAALYAERDGLLSLDERASLTLPEWRNDRRRDITINQLLSQTSGLSPSGAYFDSARDQMKAALRVPLVDPPGTRFHYGPAGYQAFGEILKRKLRRHGRSVEGYMRSKIFAPLHIQILYWKHDDVGNPLMHAGLGLNAQDWARFGEFLKENLRNPSKLTSSRERLMVLFTGHAANPAYGLSFWLNVPPSSSRVQSMKDLQPAMDGEQLDSTGPRDIYAAEGTAKQRLYLIPSRDLVIVRYADGGAYSDGDFLSRLLTGRPNPDRRRH